MLKRLFSMWNHKKDGKLEGSNNESKINLQPLSPQKNIDISVYKDAIDYALSCDDITNIALTGNYGAGKSSVLVSYEAKSLHKFMHIELPHYRSVNENVQSNKDETEMQVGVHERSMGAEQVDNKVLQQIESKIINQLLAQVDPDKIPFSVFNTRTRQSKFVDWKKIVLFFGWILSTLFLKSAVQAKSLLYLIQLLPNKKLIIIVLILWIILSIAGGVCIIKWISKHNWKIDSLRVKSSIVDIDANSDETISYFDKYMDDVLYLFEQSGYREFVFEDLDRFDIPMIYARFIIKLATQPKW